ncbi:hypothetical protein [Xylanibacter muris]|nr:hypothetical protein [Xylanibacter muris]
MKSFAIAAISLLLAACGGNKSSNSQQQEEPEKSRTPEVYTPIGLYFMNPASVLPSPPGGEDDCGYLPDFITYPDDLTKCGLRGPVKEIVFGVSTIKWTIRFNMDGNMTNYQFRMDSRGEYGNGFKMEYDAAGLLTMLGRDFRRRSANSHRYIYTNGKLTRREYGRGYREYIWKDGKDGVRIPQKSVTNGLKPFIDMVYTQNDDGFVQLSDMSYERPSLPGALTAKECTSHFEYGADGRLVKVLAHISGSSNSKYRTMFAECTYEYNEKGDVAVETICLYDNDTPERHQLYSVTQKYTYTYDGHNNWTRVQLESSNPERGSIPYLDRIITYYSEEELQRQKLAEKEFAEKPFIGEWNIEDTEEFEDPEGNKETVQKSSTLVINFYNKFIPVGCENEQWGLFINRSLPSMGMERFGAFDIMDAKVKGNQALIRMKGVNSGDTYSAVLIFNPTDKSIKVQDIKFIEEAPAHSGEESDFEYDDLEPLEGIYGFSKRNTDGR